MGKLVLLLAVSLATLLAAAQSSRPAQNASQNNNSGASAYGNNTYNSGAHEQAATGRANASKTTKPTDNFAPPVPPPPSDNAALQAHIDNALRSEPSLNDSHVSSHVTDDAIELTGSVASVRNKTTAERIASSFDGNRKLSDKLVVTAAQPTATAPVAADKPESSRR